MAWPYLEVCLAINWVMAKFHSRQRNPSHARAPKLPTKSWGGGAPADLLVSPVAGGGAQEGHLCALISVAWGFLTHTSEPCT